MTNLIRARGFATIAQLIIVIVVLLGVGTVYLSRTPGKDAGTDIPPPLVVTDANFSQIFSTLKRIDGVDSVYFPRVAGVYSPEEVIRGAPQLHNRFIEVRGAVTMAGRQPPRIQKPGDPVWMPSIGPAFVTPSGTIVLNNPSGLSNVGMPGFEQFALRGIFRVTTTNGAPTEYYLAIPPLCENCVNVLRSQINSASCTADADCKLIYSSCDCEAVPVNDPRTELPSTIMCAQNNCTNSVRTTKAVCENRRCTIKFTAKTSPPPRGSSKYELYISHEREKYGGDPPTVLEGGEVPSFLIDVAKSSHSLPEPFKKPFTIVATLHEPDGSTFQKSFSAGSSICHPYDPVGPASTYPADPCQFIGLQPPIHFSFGDIPGGTLTQRGTYRITATADNEDVKINDYTFSIRTSRIDSLFVEESVAGYHLEQKVKGAPYFRHGENTDAFRATYKNISGTRNQRQLFEAAKLLEVYIGISRSSEEVARNESYKYHSFLDELNPANVFWQTKTTPEGSFLLLEIFGRNDFLAVWPSGKQFVQILGSQTFESDEQQFVREYLKKYPSSLR